MKIQCPLNQQTLERIGDYVQAGADEFYFGYRNELVREGDCLNRRFGELVNFDTLDHAKLVVEQVIRTHRKVFVVFNELSYPEHWHKPLIREMQELCACGASGVIVSDINLIMAVRDAKPTLFLALSSTAHVLNARAAAFYGRFGINRLVLPRQLAPHEIKALIQAGDTLEYELILMNEECPNLEGLCSFAHIRGENSPNICRQAILYNELSPGAGYVVDACGACALFDLKEFSGLVLKIAGRGMGADWILNDVRFLKSAVSMLGDHESAQGFALACAQEHKRIYRDACRRQCYYHTDYLPPRDITGGHTPSDISQGVVKYGAATPHPELAQHSVQGRVEPE